MLSCEPTETHFVQLQNWVLSISDLVKPLLEVHSDYGENEEILDGSSEVDPKIHGVENQEGSSGHLIQIPGCDFCEAIRRMRIALDTLHCQLKNQGEKLVEKFTNNSEASLAN